MMSFFCKQLQLQGTLLKIIIEKIHIQTHLRWDENKTVYILSAFLVDKLKIVKAWPEMQEEIGISEENGGPGKPRRLLEDRRGLNGDLETLWRSWESKETQSLLMQKEPRSGARVNN